MKREEFVARITDLVNNYIEYYVGKDGDLQLRVNPMSHAVDLVGSHDRLFGIADSEAVIESAAAADDESAEDAADFQVKQNPDFYSIGSLIATDKDGKRCADRSAIESVAKLYFPE